MFHPIEISTKLVVNPGFIPSVCQGVQCWSRNHVLWKPVPGICDVPCKSPGFAMLKDGLK